MTKAKRSEKVFCERLCLVLSVVAQKSTVAKARRIHLFPCRTQKLSFLTPKVVGGQLPARKGSCRAHGGLAQLGEHLPYKQEVTGSSPVSSIESLAQLVEHLTFNQRVGSSSLPRLIGPEKTQAGVAELADALDLGSSVFGRVGSSPTTRTMPI